MLKLQLYIAVFFLYHNMLTIFEGNLSMWVDRWLPISKGHEMWTADH